MDTKLHRVALNNQPVPWCVPVPRTCRGTSSVNPEGFFFFLSSWHLKFTSSSLGFCCRNAKESQDGDRGCGRTRYCLLQKCAVCSEHPPLTSKPALYFILLFRFNKSDWDNQANLLKNPLTSLLIKPYFKYSVHQRETKKGKGHKRR